MSTPESNLLTRWSVISPETSLSFFGSRRRATLVKISDKIGRLLELVAGLNDLAPALREIDKLASRIDRSRNYMVNQAIDQLLEIHAWQIEQIRESSGNTGTAYSKPALYRAIPVSNTGLMRLLYA